MPYKTGSWGKQAKERSKSRSEYFKKIFTSKREELRKEVLKKYGNKCKKCGFSDYRALQIDHINGGGHIERKSMNNYLYYLKVLDDETNKYQLLCANCNWIKKDEDKEKRNGGDY